MSIGCFGRHRRQYETIIVVVNIALSNINSIHNAQQKGVDLHIFAVILPVEFIIIIGQLIK